MLKNTLIRDTRVLLGLSECLDAVVPPPPAPPVRRPDQVQPLPPGTRVVDVFDEVGRGLLILGQPGAGKTTLLLELARDLLDLATQDPTHQIPVVFPLSTWAETRRPVAEWLVDELSRTDGSYCIGRKRAQDWVDSDQILPLLDGLDEVKPEHRAACVRAINDFRNTHGLLPLVICSRTADYQALSVPLRLQDAIVVQPLTRSQVDTYFADLGPSGRPVRRALDEDTSLRELLDTPLMLWVVAVTYAGDSDARPCPGGSGEERRDRLFAAYVDRVLRHRYADRMGHSRGGEAGRRGADADDEEGRRSGKPYPRTRTLHWLTWLAWQMDRHSQAVFYIERLQPDWLSGGQRWAFGLVHRLVVGLVVGLVVWLVVGLVVGLAVGQVLGLYAGLSLGLVVGLAVGQVVGVLYSPSEKIICIETFKWSWPKLSEEDKASGCGGCLVGGVLGGLIGGLAGIGGTVGAGAWIVGLPVWLYIILKRGLSFKDIETRNIPNEGIHRSAWNALVFGLRVVLFGGMLGGVLGGLAYGLFGGGLGGLVYGVLGGLPVGVLGGLIAGGQACLQHLALRLLLVRNGSAPWDYANFLDYAAERILLRKVGGGYTFIHRMLLEYFAARYDESSVEAAPNAEPPQIERGRPAPPSSAC